MNVVLGAAIAWPVAASRVVLEYLGSAEAFRTLKRRRVEIADDEPEMWAALMPIWPRLSSHLVKHITEGNPPRLGYLMFGGLKSAVREEQNLSLRRAPLFSGLGALTPRLNDSVVDHVSGPESISEVLRILARFAERLRTTVFRADHRPASFAFSSYRTTLIEARRWA